MEKSSMRKPDTYNQTLLSGVPPMEGHHKKYNIKSDMKVLQGQDCEVEKIMMFLKEIGVFKEIKIL